MEKTNQMSIKKVVCVTAISQLTVRTKSNCKGSDKTYDYREITVNDFVSELSSMRKSGLSRFLNQ
jgi:hypothetical protein